jgi:hypothetical protein
MVADKVGLEGMRLSKRLLIRPINRNTASCCASISNKKDILSGKLVFLLRKCTFLVVFGILFINCARHVRYITRKKDNFSCEIPPYSFILIAWLSIVSRHKTELLCPSLI